MNIKKSSLVIVSLFYLFSANHPSIASLEEKEKIVQKGLVAQRGSCIKTDHLFIAPFHEADIKKYQEIQENDLLTPGRHFHELMNLDVLQGYAKALKNPKSIIYDSNYPFRPYSVFFLDSEDKLNFKLIGFFLLSPLSMKAGIKLAGCSIIYYIIDTPFRNKGFGKEMLKAITTDLVSPLINRKYPVVNDSDIADNDIPPMPFCYLTAYIDLDNIASIKTAMKSGFTPYDLTVDPTKKEGEGYQVEFRFSKSEIAINSLMLKAILENVKYLPDPIVKEALIQQCKIRVKQREIEDTQFANMLGNLLEEMGPKKLIKELQKDMQSSEK